MRHDTLTIKCWWGCAATGFLVLMSWWHIAFTASLDNLFFVASQVQCSCIGFEQVLFKRNRDRGMWQIATQSMHCWHIQVELADALDFKAAAVGAVMRMLHLPNTALWLRPSSVKTWCKHQLWSSDLAERQTEAITQPTGSCIANPGALQLLT